MKMARCEEKGSEHKMEPNRRCTSEPAQLRMQYHRQSVAYCHYRGIEITQSLQGLASAPPKRCKKTVRPGDTPHNSQQHSEEQNLHRQKHWIGSKPRTPDRELRQEGHIKKTATRSWPAIRKAKSAVGPLNKTTYRRRTIGKNVAVAWSIFNGSYLSGASPPERTNRQSSKDLA